MVLIKGGTTIKKPKSVSLNRLDGGLNLRDLEMKIGDIQSPSLLNVEADGIGGLTKRGGQAKLYPNSLGATAINALTYYGGKMIVAWGTGLYTQTLSNQPISIKTGLTNAKGTFITYNSKLYYFNGHEALVYNGTTVTNLTDDPYDPYVGVDLKPDGTQGGTVTPDVDDINLVNPYFRKTFIADGTSTVYHLNITNLDDITEVKVNGVVKTLTTDYSINKVAGTVTFVTAPPVNAVDPSNVDIRMKKADSARVNQILNCTVVCEYESKLFLTGNTNFPNKYWVMGLTDKQDATYWPELGYNNTIGGTDDPITGFTEFYNKLIIFKEHSTHALTYVTNSSNDLTTSLKKISGTIGCDMPGSIQTVNNNPIFCNTYAGLHLIVSTIIESEKNVVPISALINNGVRQGLLDEAIENLEGCASVDHNHKYRLCVGTKEYIWDYSLQPYGGSQENLHWFLNDNINARQYLVIGTDLYYGRNATGEVVKFIDTKNDFGLAIDAYFTTKLYDFGVISKLKNIRHVYFATRPGTRSAISVEFIDDAGTKTATAATVATGGWSQCSFANFTWAVSRFSKPIKLKPNIHNKEYFQIKFTNNQYNENLSLLNLVIEYVITKNI